MHILQKLKPIDGPKCKAFALEMLSRIEDDEDYLKKVMITDEACFHVLGKDTISCLYTWTRRLSKEENPFGRRDIICINIVL